MKTDELIAVLAADAVRRPLSVARLLAGAVAAGAAAGLAVALAGWGPRADLVRALASSAFWMKALYAAALGVAGLAAMERLGRPGGRAPQALLLALGAAALVFAFAWREAASLPLGGWSAQVLGHTWRVCSLRIAAIAAPGFLAALWSLSRMAPTSPRLAGASAGLMAGGLGAVVYGLCCDETAAAFLATWYSLGVLVWVAVGALFGPRLLRW